jgi:peptidoglycan LD-endopeptidase CwlK
MIDINETCLKRLDLSKIYPAFLLKISKVLDDCLDQGHVYVATSGYRSYKEQDLLFAQGRTAPGKICTKARGGQSAHNLGLAMDFARDLDPRTPGLQPSWDLKDMQNLIDNSVAYNLNPGANWTSFKDVPHVDIGIKRHGITLAQLDAIYRKKGSLEDVWAFLDQYDWE